MKAQPFSVFPLLTPEQRIDYECSDRILLPKDYFDALEFQMNDMLLLSNDRGECVYGSVRGTHVANGNILYMPSWMFYRLSSVEPIHIAICGKSKCTAIQIRPENSPAYARSDYLEQLNSAIVLYHSLMVGVKMPINLNGSIEYITIEELLPSSLKCAHVYDTGPIDIVLLPPMRIQKPMFLDKSGGKEPPSPLAFVGKGAVLGGSDSPPSLGTAIRDAARRRYNSGITAISTFTVCCGTLEGVSSALN